MGARILFSFTISIISLVLIVILLTKNKQVTARFLVIPLLVLTATNFLFFLFESKLMLNVPFLFRIGPLLSFIMAPSICLYLQHELKGKNRITVTDSLHLIPCLVFFADYFPFYMSSNEYKRNILTQMYQDVNTAGLFQEGWFLPPGIHDFLRHAIALAYILFMVDMVNRYKKDKANQRSAWKLLEWIKVLLFFFFILTIAGLFNYLFLSTHFLWAAIVWEPTIISLLLYIFLVFNPDILYGSYLIAITDDNDKKKLVALPEDLADLVRINLNKFVTSQQFLNKNIRIKDVADGIGVRPYILSTFIYQTYEMHFNDFINMNRINFVKRRIKSKEWNAYTLEAIAEKAGFTNRTTFLTSFKKFTNMTPTFYIHLITQEGDDFTG